MDDGVGRDEKNDTPLRVYLSESTLTTLKRVAKFERRDPSEYIRILLEGHLYGHPLLTERDREGA